MFNPRSGEMFNPRSGETHKYRRLVLPDPSASRIDKTNAVEPVPRPQVRTSPIDLA